MKQKTVRLFVYFCILVFSFQVITPLVYAPPSAWEHTLKLTIDADTIDATLTDFPVLVEISSASGITGLDATGVFNEIGSDYDAVSFWASDNSTRLYYEVDTFNATAEVGLYWVCVPSISSSVDTVIYFSYDASQDGSAYNDRSQVWDSSYVMVYHFNDLTTSSIMDSSLNAYNGTKKGAGEPAVLDGLVGKAQKFDGTNDYIDITGTLTNLYNQDDLTITMFIKNGAFTGATRMPIDFGYWYADYGFLDQMGNGGNYHTYFVKNSAGSGVSAAPNFSPSKWELHGFKWSGASGNAYHVVNETISAFAGTPSGTLSMSAYSPRIGASSQSSEWYDGYFDELRISNVSRSDAWICAEYSTLTDQMITYQDLTPPTYSGLSYSTTVAGANCIFTASFDDNTDLDNYIFSYNSTGSWVNNTVASFTTTPQSRQVTKALNDTMYTVVGYRWYFNDTVGLWNDTGIQTLIIAYVPGGAASVGFTDPLFAYLITGDYLYFIVACYTSAMGSAFYGIIVFFISALIYLRTRSFMLVGLLYMLVGPTFLILFWELSFIAVIFTVIGLASVFVELILVWRQRL